MSRKLYGKPPPQKKKKGTPAQKADGQELVANSLPGHHGTQAAVEVNLAPPVGQDGTASARQKTGSQQGDDCEHFLRALERGPPWQRPRLRAALRHHWGSLPSLAV